MNSASQPMQAMPDSKPQCDLLLRGGIIITIDDERTVLQQGSVAIAGQRIVAIGDDAALSAMRADRVVDCYGKVVMPGFVDTHDHLFQHLVRSLGMTQPSLYDWLVNFMTPVVDSLSAESLHAAGLLGAMAAVSSGVTCVVDNPYGIDDPAAITALAQGLGEVGVRGVIGRGMHGPITMFAQSVRIPERRFQLSVRDEIEVTEACMQAHPWGALVSVVPYPEHISLVSEEMIQESVALARKYGTPWQTHGTESELDTQPFLARHGQRPIEWLAAEGLLDQRASLAHCIWVSPAEIEILEEARAGVAHNPISNMLSGKGVCPISTLLDHGITAGLGVDGSIGFNFDMFATMLAAMQAQRALHSDVNALTIEEALEMATKNGAQIANIDAGRLAVGALADIAVIDMSDIRLSPTHVILAQLVFAASSRDVCMTVVNGRIVFEDGRFPLADETSARAEIDDQARRLRGMLPGTEPTTLWQKSVRSQRILRTQRHQQGPEDHNGRGA